MSDAEFRAEVRAFLAENLPEDMGERGRIAVHPTRADYLGWAQRLAARGWAVPGWPAEHGGSGWSGRQRQIFEEEALLAGAPPYHIQSVFLAGPLIVAFGSEAQKAALLPGIREGRELWAQGFSEPDSGSDLASLRTRAVRDGDDYVINGQKIWTSDAYFCDRMFALVRTNPDVKKQAGISMMLFPLDLPGITIRPIPQIDDAHSLCEVFFDNVRVPADALLGEEGMGWTYAKYLLDNERTTTAEVPRNRRELARFRRILASQRSGDRMLLDDPAMRGKLAELECDFAALETGVAALLDLPHGTPVGVGPSVLKIQGTELMQAILEAEVAALGPHGVAQYALEEPDPASPGPADAPGVSAEFLFRRAATIYGGSTEVQLGIIGRTLRAMAPEEDDAALDEERAMLRDAIRGQARRGETGWATIAEQGWLAATLPEGAGGFGWGVAEGVLIARELGRALIAAPVADELAAVRALLDADPSRTDMVSDWAEGGTRLALAHEERGSRGDPLHVETYIRNGRLCGTKLGVALTDASGQLLISAREGDAEGISLLLLPVGTAGLDVRRYVTIDGRPAADIRFDGVRVDDAMRVGAAGQAGSALRDAVARALLDNAAEAVGVLEQAFWVTRDYIAVRKQFGRALIEFQVLEHRLARMYMEAARARAMLAYGAAAFDLDDPDERMARLFAMKARVDRSAFFVGSQAMQLHGGISLTREYPIGRYFTRLMVLAARLGGADEHLARFGDALVAEIRATEQQQGE